jgi:hypothetical protein
MKVLKLEVMNCEFWNISGPNADGFFKRIAEIVIINSQLSLDQSFILEYKTKTTYATLSIRFKNLCVYIEI